MILSSFTLFPYETSQHQDLPFFVVDGFRGPFHPKTVNSFNGLQSLWGERKGTQFFNQPEDYTVNPIHVGGL